MVDVNEENKWRIRLCVGVCVGKESYTVSGIGVEPLVPLLLSR